MTMLHATHQFFPVGQGLFAAGSVEVWSSKQSSTARDETYRWVYDCGTTSAQRLVKNAIAALKSDCHGEKIDLLTLSHFDWDHISGVVDLLNEIGAKTVMLPWAPLWHRLLIGFDQGLGAGDPEMLFYVDPVEYLKQVADDGFERVLFVMPSDDDGPPFMADPDPTRDLDGSDKPSGPGDATPSDKLDLFHYQEESLFRVLRSGQSIPVFGVWEFIPYNDPDTRPDDAAGFASKVHIRRKALLGSSEEDRKTALDDLKSLYQKTFKGSKKMNDVSLMLYGGAVGNWTGQSLGNCDCFFGRAFRVCRCWKRYETRGAILLTGDGNFTSAAEWDRLERYLDARRAKGPSVFQVAHHGARSSWYDGLATQIAPQISVFSSDPSRKKGHPHAEVLRDFWPFDPAQVDQHKGFSMRIVLER